MSSAGEEYSSTASFPHMRMASEYELAHKGDEGDCLTYRQKFSVYMQDPTP